MEYPIKRDLDGVYFRVNRNNKWESICFSDLTQEERLGVLDNHDKEWVIGLCNHLAECIRVIGDKFGIISSDKD